MEKWNGKGYDIQGKLESIINNGAGNIKEYNNEGKLIFESEYLNGKRNGKGKDYYKGDLIFEGEYLHGKRWSGKGKEYERYFFDYELMFEGEYLDGKRWNDNGKEYNNYLNPDFEGEYLNGKRWNGRVYYYIDGTKANFEYLNGKPL